MVKFPGRTRGVRPEAMGETVFFAEVISFKAKADALFAMVAARLQTLLPCALVEHVGSTSLPGDLGRRIEGR